MIFGGARGNREQGRLEKRAANMTMEQLLMYSEGEAQNVGRAIDDFQKHRGLDELEEAMDHHNRLGVLLTTLYNRLDTE